MIRRTIVILVLTLCFQLETVYASQPGGVIFLESCPGDVKASIDEAKTESYWGVILTSVLTGIVKEGVGRIGSGLTAAATEKTVDMVHSGGYFYRWTNTDVLDSSAISMTPNIRCLIFASRSKGKATKTDIDSVTKDYVPQELKQNTLGVVQLAGGSVNKDVIAKGVSTLKSTLNKLGFSGLVTPGLIMVVYIEYSNQNTEFRFVPRYAYLDHSLRKG